MAQMPRKKAPRNTGPGTAEGGPAQPSVEDILSGKVSGLAGETARPAGSADALFEFKDMISEQRERQNRLRHVQQFLTSPLFVEMRDRPVTVSEDRAAIEERKRDLDYRIKVLESLVSILIEERDFLDKVQSTDEADAADGAGKDTDQKAGQGHGTAAS